MKIRLIDFWPGADTRQTFIFSALLPFLKIPIRLSIYSVYRPWWLMASGWLGRQIEIVVQKLRDRHLDKQQESENFRNVWWTGENVRPPLEKKFHHYISFDQDSHRGRNTYFPLFYVEAVLPSKDTFKRIGLDQFNVTKLLSHRKSASLDFASKGFACAFINNPEPTRIAAVSELSRHGRVDVFGKYSGRPVDSKMSRASAYKFVLCFENDLYPGYVTEKLLDAYLCNAVPLYWGDLGREEHINRRSFINLNDFASLEEFSRFVANMTEKEYSEIYRQPLLRSIPSIDPLVDALLGAGKRDKLKYVSET